jgi:hypothetical protein
MRIAFLGICVLGLTIGVSGQVDAPATRTMQQVGSATVTADQLELSVQSRRLPPNGSVVFEQRRVFIGNVDIQTPTATITADRAEQVGTAAFELSGRVVFSSK